MPRPVCVPCAREMDVHIVGAHIGFFAKVSGLEKPYNVYSGDIFKCGGCGHEIVGVYAQSPFYRHFETKPLPTLAIRVEERTNHA